MAAYDGEADARVKESIRFDERCARFISLQQAHAARTILRMSDAIILFAHGSRDPQWAEPLRALRDLLAQQRPQAPVTLAFLELMQPDLHTAVKEAAEAGARSVLVAPLFLALGAHLKKDLPALVEAAARAHPQLKIRVLPPIGENEELLGAIAGWIGKNAS